MCYTEYDPSGNPNSLFHVGAGILNLLLLYDFFIFFLCIIYTKIWDNMFITSP